MRALLGLLLRRLLWLVPTLFFVSVLAFWAVSSLRSPAERSSLEPDHDRIRAEQRARFLDLPRFVNTAPRDVRARSLEAARSIATAAPNADAARAELSRLGGAALPHLLPALDGFPPDQRAEVAVALAPIARRMRLPNAAAYEDRARATLLWSRFWSDRSIEFRDAQVRTAIDRLARYRDPGRTEDLRALDTFALPAIMEVLRPPSDAASLQVARSLIEVAANATGRDDRIGPDSSIDAARETVRRWQAHWLVYGGDYSTLDAAGRAAATVTQTRYGKWVAQLVWVAQHQTLQETPLGRLGRDTKVTLVVLFSGVLLAYLIGLGLGLASALVDRRGADVVVFGVLTVLFAIPPAVTGVLALSLTGPDPGVLLAALVVALSVAVFPARHERARTAELLSESFVLATRARGITPPKLALRCFRHSIGLVVAMLSMEPQAALAACLVAEQVFGLPGIGQSLVVAFAERDVGYLMMLVLASAVIATLLIFAADVITANLHPKLRGRMWERR